MTAKVNLHQPLETIQGLNETIENSSIEKKSKVCQLVIKLLCKLGFENAILVHLTTQKNDALRVLNSVMRDVQFNQLKSEQQQKTYRTAQALLTERRLQKYFGSTPVSRDSLDLITTAVTKFNDARKNNPLIIDEQSTPDGMEVFEFILRNYKRNLSKALDLMKYLSSLPSKFSSGRLELSFSEFNENVRPLASA